MLAWNSQTKGMKMPTWINNIPRDNGASDFEDSARLAGMMAVANMGPCPDPEVYLDSEGNLARWWGSKLPFTRDQLIPLAYYYTRCNNFKQHVLERYRAKIRCSATSFTAPNGKDYLAPHHRSHLRACTGGQWSFVGKLFLLGEICFQSYLHSEPNQLICMMLTAGPKYVKIWKRFNPRWALDIQDYWCGWRDEALLADLIIKRLGG